MATLETQINRLSPIMFPHVQCLFLCHVDACLVFFKINRYSSDQNIHMWKKLILHLERLRRFVMQLLTDHDLWLVRLHCVSLSRPLQGRPHIFQRAPQTAARIRLPISSLWICLPPSYISHTPSSSSSMVIHLPPLTLCSLT